VSGVAAGRRLRPVVERYPRLGRIIAYELPLDIGLVLLWCQLWASLSALTVLTGAVVAVLTTRLLPLPAVPLSDRLNVWALAVFIVRFGVDIVVASLTVAWSALRPQRGEHRSSIIAVQLRSESELLGALTCIAISLVPGSFMVEFDAREHIVLLHVLDTPDRSAADAARRSALATEARLIRAIGTRADLDRIRS
jgi:multicomponent Na+:H+ antiporter subunit E